MVWREAVTGRKLRLVWNLLAERSISIASQLTCLLFARRIAGV